LSCRASLTFDGASDEQRHTFDGIRSVTGLNIGNLFLRCSFDTQLLGQLSPFDGLDTKVINLLQLVRSGIGSDNYELDLLVE
jgi:hypothetical protein